ncbi:hypothetical protein RM572_00295 [Streptomyces sp. DSM 42041]|uniref:Uncharacterized protein n=1 Tax=Streptomyces hazeniae TaxID=3075538 RepID=A0ABU2NKC6_9ACTN|nr:hypothetical protein [Streptomyces sp. DSM 42041]MDT0377215.1 hypothetical protein [Streptomyces sp. DSM 42041]
MNSHTQTIGLALYWEVSGSTITDDFTRDEITPAELWDRWYKDSVQDGEAGVLWSITTPEVLGVFEAAPFQYRSRFPLRENFLSFYEWPEHADTGERLNFMRLPVLDFGWSRDRADKGGFIQELTGWKPSPLQHTFPAEQVAHAAGLVE